MFCRPVTQGSERWWLTKAETAARLGVSPTTLRKMIRAGQLPVIRLGGREVVRKADLAVFEQGRPA